MTIRRTTVFGVLAAALGAAVVFQPEPSLGANLFASGEQARELCASSTEWCAGFVAGALDGWAALEAYYSGEKFCLPADLTTGRIVDIFVRRMAEATGRESDPAAYVLYEAMIEQFPCSVPSSGE